MDVTDVDPVHPFPGYREDHPLDLPEVPPAVEKQFLALFAAWQHGRDFATDLAKVGNCSNPIKLIGSSETFDTDTGARLSYYSSADEPRGVTYVRCGSRLASVCPSCARLYAGDMFQVIRAGISGGKGVPESVGQNPLVFATLTAPSFGHVHGNAGSICRRSTGAKVCPHGRPASCSVRHADGDDILGQPICVDCYDYNSQVVWQWWAPQMWKYFITALRRQIAKELGICATRLGEVATVQYAKVGESQRCGVIHFHALICLDGPRTPEGFAPAPAGIGAADIARLLRRVAARIRLDVPPVDEYDRERTLAFGRQVDARPVSIGRRTDEPDQPLSDGQVAGYLAKYSTKSASDDVAADNAHHARLRETVHNLGIRAIQSGNEDYRLLLKWEHLLGFRGHFATKSRRYLVALGALRRARRRARALIAKHRVEGRRLDLASMEADLLADDAEETTLVIGHWRYAGTGWANEAETLLATAAAARAREYDQWKAEQRRTKRTNRTS